MKCPHCGYDYAEDKKIHEDEPYKQIGHFFKLPIDMERDHEYETQRISLYACPSCMKTFVYRW
jgi:transposase-like protein